MTDMIIVKNELCIIIPIPNPDEVMFLFFTQGISGCTSLRVLDVAGNHLTMFPTDVCGDC